MRVCGSLPPVPRWALEVRTTGITVGVVVGEAVEEDEGDDVAVDAGGGVHTPPSPDGAYLVAMYSFIACLRDSSLDLSSSSSFMACSMRCLHAALCL